MKYDIGISNAIVISAHERYRPQIVSIGVIDDRIVRISHEPILSKECQEWIDGTDKILMPGLVNGHCHGDMTLARGLGDDMTLAEQNAKFGPCEWFLPYITDDDRYASRQLTYCEALLSGTTFIMENMYWGLGERSAAAMAETGIRGALAEDIRISFQAPDILQPDESIEAFVNSCRENGLMPMMGSISEEDFDKDRLCRIREKITRFGLKQTFHLAENDWRIELVRNKWKKGSVEYLNDIGVLTDEVIASHVVHLSNREIQMLADSGTKVVNTPLCEMKIVDGIAPIVDMVRGGVTVCLGTDGAMWNNSNDIFREMKGMALIHTMHSGIRSLYTEDILDMATINGAKAFGLEFDYGTIEEGKKADFILVQTTVPHMRPLRIGRHSNVASMIVFNATGQDVTDVFVDGKQVVKGRKLLTINVSDVISKVQAASEAIEAKL